MTWDLGHAASFLSASADSTVKQGSKMKWFAMVPGSSQIYDLIYIFYSDELNGELINHL